ncbi:hypothetical protein NK718_20685 [Alsobacter sp. SYSU M60028]|uniref:SRPBCC family protein n=1 Tax=Alsobacter ponti TaxID=2962936 RepID=A0ABT1LHG7_9HYPH|nr:hypothetical protein [Alsobacter ponti]MCP8940950.1 hypothetical protein [Alsobacter ponti]
MAPDPTAFPAPSHVATVLVAAEAADAFAFLADPLALGGWSLGCMETGPDEALGLHRGRSLFDGAEGWFEIDARADLLLIDYLVGTRERRRRRISARVVAAEDAGLPAGHCYVSMIAWRPGDMDEARWRRLCAAHEAEIWLIKAQIESGYRPTPGGRVMIR